MYQENPKLTGHEIFARLAEVRILDSEMSSSFLKLLKSTLDAEELRTLFLLAEEALSINLAQREDFIRKEIYPYLEQVFAAAQMSALEKANFVAGFEQLPCYWSSDDNDGVFGLWVSDKLNY